jgi:hypothetical protein
MATKFAIVPRSSAGLFAPLINTAGASKKNEYDEK